MKKAIKWIIGIIVLMAIIGGCMGGGNDSSSTTAKKENKPKTYTEVSADTLIDATKANAAKAKQDYNGKDLKIVGGKVGNIDSDSSYFTVNGSDRFEFKSIHVKPSNSEQKKEFANLVKDKPIVVYCTVTDVGDLAGVYVKLDKFEQ